MGRSESSEDEDEEDGSEYESSGQSNDDDEEYGSEDADTIRSSTVNKKSM